ncbi:MAG: alpha/beta hydrolase [Hyphomicrobiales bacterium]|nr:alpha/beta hydrolase [Hyphomicrobiales bacterium]
MPIALNRGVRIHYEAHGSGVPILFIHEFAGDHRSWDDQVRHFGRGWRTITMAARGYPPSDCPAEEAEYGQRAFEADAIAVLDAAGVDRAHVVGLSMGGYTALMLALRAPERIRSVVAAGAGSGSALAGLDAFKAECRATADRFEREGRIDAEAMSLGPTRVQLAVKDPVGWSRSVGHLAEHPAHAAAKTLRTVQAGRPSLYELEAGLAAITAPVLLMVGDEDEPCLDVNLWLKRTMPVADLVVLPGTGHAINLEEPALFNAFVERFVVDVERGAWRPRDPRARAIGTATSLGLGPARRD